MNTLIKDPVTTGWRKTIILFSMALMLTGLLFSRGVLSSGLVIFAAATLIHKNIKTQLDHFLSSPFLWVMTLLFFITLISGLWTEDLSKWSQILRIKLPLLFLPICFAGLNDLKQRDWEKIAWVFLIVISIGAGWSLSQYFLDVKEIHAGYLQAHTIKTPIGNDHVRFSLSVSVAILAAIVLFITNRNYFSKATGNFLWILIAGLGIYLHVLAVRTGLLCFYTSLLIFIAWSLWNQKNKIRSVFFLCLLLSFPVIAYFIFPTFKNRISYLKYDLSFVRKNIYLPGSNDGTRIISIRAGWQIQNQKPLTGAGFGDIETETKKWYQENYPQMIETDRILPSCEWMMYGAGAGWPGFILFSVIMLMPFFLRGLKKNLAWWLLNISMALSYLFDIGLEVQYGVFVHAFILLWWYQWLQSEGDGPIKSQKIQASNN